MSECNPEEDGYTEKEVETRNEIIEAFQMISEKHETVLHESSLFAAGMSILASDAKEEVNVQHWILNTLFQQQHMQLLILKELTLLRRTLESR